MAPLPTGTVTFLFTDIEGSTRLWEQHPEAMREALARHDALITEGIERHGGVVVKGRAEGDSFFAVFARATDVAAAACVLQQALAAETWPAETPLRVRMALHTGEAELREGDYYGGAVNRCARLRAAGHGGQVLLSLPTAELVRDNLPEGASLSYLGLHRLQDLQRPEQIYQLNPRDRPADFPPLRSLDALPNNLPAQLTSFIGREREMAELKRLLGGGVRYSVFGVGADASARTPNTECRTPNARLVTLTGSGGCGKTRLALQVAADLVGEYTDGAWLVELAPVTDPALVPQSIAAVLGVAEQPGRPLLQSVVDWLRPRSLLLVLDNCEHLVDTCAPLVEGLLRACPGLRILASSREALGVPGETPWRVPSLSLPPVEGVGGRVRGVGDDRAAPYPLPPTPHTLTQYAAVQLFIERATTVQPAFTVTNQNAPAVAQICHRLDGIPLAIELAAARVKALPVETLNERLHDMFRLLTGGSRTVLPRQQTLRALIDWSYDLLSEPERVLLRRLSVFSGGWTLEAAEAVGAGEGLEEWEVLDRLTTLVEKSLVQYEERNGTARYRLLETVRQYSRDRLLESGEAAAVRDRHLAFFLELAERAEPAMEGPDLVLWLDRLETEHDNLRAALEWSKSAERGAEIGLRLTGVLRQFWIFRDHQSEGQEWLEGALAAAGDTAPRGVRAKALLSLGTQLGPAVPERRTAVLQESLDLFRQLDDRQGISRALFSLATGARRQDEWQRVRALSEEALANARQAGSRYSVVLALSLLGSAARNLGDHQQAAVLFDESIALGRQLGNPWALAWPTLQRGQLAKEQGDDDRARALAAEGEALLRAVGTKWALAAMLGTRALALSSVEGDYRSAVALLEESLAIRRELQDWSGVAWNLLTQGHTARWQGEDEKARASYEESMRIGHELGEKAVIAWALVNIGLLDVRQGALAAARTRASESLAIWPELGDNQGVVRCLECLAQVAYAQGNPGQMARLFGAAEALREAIPWPLRPADRDDYAAVPAARAALGEAAFAAAWAQGRALTVEQAIAAALASNN